MAASYKIVVTVSVAAAENVRAAIAEARGGKIGKDSMCSFSVSGTGRFKPEEGANPNIGSVGKAESVSEERIEVTCSGGVVQDVVKAIRRVHPYEEVAIDIYELIDVRDL